MTMTRRAAFVVGGSGALGSAISRRLARDFDCLYFSYRSNADGATALAGELTSVCRVDCAAVDVRNQLSVSTALNDAWEKFGCVNAVVFAAGVDIAQPFVSEISASQWRGVIESELLGFAHVVAAALPIFRRQAGGALVNVGTFATRSFPPGDALSAVPKAGAEMLIKAVAREEGRYGIRANTVSPGIIEAGLGAKLMEGVFTKDVWEQQRKRVALRRFGRAEEVAEAVAFLVSEKAAYITGMNLIVDGGLHL